MYNVAVRGMVNKSQESYKSATFDIQHGLYNRATSSLYYSCFQLTSALMLYESKSTSKHTHVRAFVNRDLARPGKISIDSAALFNELFDARNDADYSGEIVMTQDFILSLMPRVDRYLYEVSRILEGYLHSHK